MIVETALTLAMMAQPQCHVSKHRARVLVQHALKAEKKYKLPTGILVAILLAESGGRDVISWNGVDSADVGPWQINCQGDDILKCVKRVRPLKKNADKAGYILSLGRKACKEGGRRWYCKIKPYGYIARYNPGSIKWFVRVMKIWKKLIWKAKKHTAMKLKITGTGAKV